MSDYNFILQKHGLRIEAVDYGDGKDGGQGFRLTAVDHGESEELFVGRELGPKGLAELCECVHTYLTGGGEREQAVRKGELANSRELLRGFIAGAIAAGNLQFSDGF